MCTSRSHSQLKYDTKLYNNCQQFFHTFCKTFCNPKNKIGCIDADFPLTSNNSSIYGCQQASDFSSAHSLLFLRKIYDDIIFFQSISGVFICEFSICPTYRMFAQLCTKCSRQIAMQHRGHRLLHGKSLQPGVICIQKKPGKQISPFSGFLTLLINL